MNDVNQRGELGEEQLLKKAFARVQAPSGLKQRILAVKDRRALPLRRQGSWQLIERLAATVLLTVGITGTLIWHHYQVQQQAMAVKKQVYLALQITNRTLDHVRNRLAEKSKSHN
jgi:hypothetical protein